MDNKRERLMPWAVSKAANTVICGNYWILLGIGIKKLGNFPSIPLGTAYYAK